MSAPELYVIVRGGQPIWSAVTSHEQAESAAVIASVGGGMVSLLSGAAIAALLNPQPKGMSILIDDDNRAADPEDPQPWTASLVIEGDMAEISTFGHTPAAAVTALVKAYPSVLRADYQGLNR